MKFAIKRLTRSDLTFFESLFRTLEAGNQKAINLNRDVFEDALYPAAASAAQEADFKLPVTVDIFGPEAAQLYRVARHITKGTTYKNWRLNGAFVPDPEDEPGRFDGMAEGDIAVLAFEGEPVPSRVTLILVSAGASDADLHAALLDEVGGPTVPRAMRVVTEQRLKQLGETAAEDHPIRYIAPDEELTEEIEDAARGGAVGQRRLRLRARTGRLPRRITYADLAKSRVNLDEYGRDGEELIEAMLKIERSQGKIKEFEWTSDGHALGPYDFSITSLDAQVEIVDVKATTGRFKQPIHLSLGEVEEAATSERAYRIYRVFEMNKDGAKLRRSEDVRPLAKSLLSGCNLPEGVYPDSFSIDPDVLKWSDSEQLARPEED